MNKLKVGAVVYAPRVTVIWGIIADFFKGEGFEIEPIYYKDYRSQVDGLMKGEIDVAWNSPLAWLDANLRTNGKALNGSMRDTDNDRSTYLVVKKSSNTLENEFKRKKGLAMHYYFEHISNNLENDKLIAKSALLSRYGNMLGKKIVEELIVRMEKFIEKNSNIYDEKYKVYTEFEIYDSEGKKRIIDRINIDENNKKIYIYDYKTGFEPETNEKYQEQINEYRNILSKKVSPDYEIDVKLLEV